MQKKLVLASLLCSSLISSVAYSQNYDVYGREMTYTGIKSLANILGHVGIEKNSKIYNMLPNARQKTLLGQYTDMKKSTISNFVYGKNANGDITIDEDEFWGIKYQDSTRDDWKMFRYLARIDYYGANYSFYADDNVDPKVYWNRRTQSFQYRKAKLRCDGLVKRTLEQAGHNFGSLQTPWYIFSSMENDRNHNYFTY